MGPPQTRRGGTARAPRPPRGADRPCRRCCRGPRPPPAPARRAGPRCSAPAPPPPPHARRRAPESASRPRPAVRAAPRPPLSPRPGRRPAAPRAAPRPVRLGPARPGRRHAPGLGAVTDLEPRRAAPSGCGGAAPNPAGTPPHLPRLRRRAPPGRGRGAGLGVLARAAAPRAAGLRAGPGLRALFLFAFLFKSELALPQGPRRGRCRQVPPSGRPGSPCQPRAWAQRRSPIGRVHGAGHTRGTRRALRGGGRAPVLPRAPRGLVPDAVSEGADPFHP